MTGRAGGMTGRLAGWVLAGVLVIGACSPVMRYHGYVPSDAELSEIVVGRDTRESVSEKVGNPGAGGVMAGSGWYYVQSDWRHTQWRAPAEVDRQVVAISFNERGVVTNVERFGLQDGEIVALSRRVTEGGPRGMSVLRRIFSVLGQFSPGMIDQGR